MYPYYLCLQLSSSRMCRHPIGENPPQGFVRVIRHAFTFRSYDYDKDKMKLSYSKLKISPYDTDGELLPPYWSLSRVQDLIRRDVKQLDR